MTLWVPKSPSHRPSGIVASTERAAETERVQAPNVAFRS